MKRFLCLPSTFIVIMVFATLGLYILAPRQLAPTGTEDGAEKIVAPADFALLSLATDANDRLNIDFKHPWEKYVNESPFRIDREWVAVVARTVTFPSVLNQGELMLSFEYPNARILCLDAANYAGRVQGLIWAMDRDTVMEHKLFWTIDDSGDLFDRCLDIFLQEAGDDSYANDKNQLEDVKAVLSGQIQLIQETLRYAKDVKVKARPPSVGVHFQQAARDRREGPLP